MIFKDREDAARALAAELAPLVSPPCIVAAVPRGGLTAVADLFVSLTVDEEFRAMERTTSISLPCPMSRSWRCSSAPGS